jgi:CRISPR type III-B/RAMP module-associated protein Cmr5
MIDRSFTLKVFREVDDFINKYRATKGENVTVASKLRSRSRNMPIMMEDEGLLATIIFMFAKASRETYDRLIKTIGKNKIDIKGKDDELASALYLYIVMKGLNKIYQDIKIDDPIEVVHELEKRRLGVPLVKIIIRYLLEIKRLCEAMYEAE